MAILPPLWMQTQVGDPEIEYPLGVDRDLLLSAIFRRPGVIDLTSHLVVSQRAAGANMSVDVSAGRCVVRGGDDVSGPGMYLCTSTSVVNVAIAAPPSGSRVYMVYARVYDKQGSVNQSTSLSEWRIEATYSVTNPSQAPTILDGVPLATVTVTSSTSSVTNSLISSRRSRATLGTEAINGNWGENFHQTWVAGDATRPLTWSKNPDGWVNLSGWVERRVASTNVEGGKFYYWDGPPQDPNVGWDQWGNRFAKAVIPEEIRPTGVRDVICMSSIGDFHLVIFPNGSVGYRFYGDMTLVAGAFSTWVSFDGVTYRANSFG